MKDLTEVPGLKFIFSEFYPNFLSVTLPYRYMTHKMLSRVIFLTWSERRQVKLRSGKQAARNLQGDGIPRDFLQWEEFPPWQSRERSNTHTLGILDLERVAQDSAP